MLRSTRQLTDFQFWCRRLKAKMFVEQDIARQLTECVRKTKDELKIFRLSPQSYLDPNLLNSLELNIIEDQKRAERARKNASAFRSMASELEKAVTQDHTETVVNSQSEFRTRLREYEKALDSYKENEKSFRTIQSKYDRITKKLSRLQNDSNPLDVEKRRELQDKIMIERAKQDVILNEYNNRLVTESALRQELINKSDHVLEAWKNEEEKKMKFLVRKWESCIYEITNEDGNQPCTEMIRVVKNISVSDMLNKMAEHKLKPVHFMTHSPIASDGQSEANFIDGLFDFETPVEAVSESDVIDLRGAMGHIPIKKDLLVHSATLSPHLKFEDDDDDDIEEISCENTTPVSIHTGTLHAPVPRRLFWDDDPFEKTIAESNVTVNEKTDVTKMRNVKVMVLKDYKKQNNREISLHIGSRIKQLLPANEEGFSFGSKRTSTKQKKKGFYPADYVSLC
ncbi:hypothetical protein ScPMuIL_007149 [Solemya velum]